MSELAQGTPTETAISDNSADPKLDSGSGPIDPSESSEPKPKAETPDPLRSVKHRIKSNGQELELDYDEVIQRAQKADGAHKLFEDGAKAKKEAEALLAKAKSGSLDDLIDLIGIDKLLEISSHVEKSRVELSQLTDEQIEDLLFKREAADNKAKLKQIEDERTRSEHEQRTAQAFQVVEREIGDALEDAKKMGIPLADLPDIGIEIVDEQLAILAAIEDAEKKGIQYTGKIPSAKEILAQINARYDARLGTYLSKHNTDTLMKLLTPEQLKSIRMADLDKLYGDTPRPGIQQAPQAQSASVPTQRQTTNDYFKKLESKYGAR